MDSKELLPSVATHEHPGLLIDRHRSVSGSDWWLILAYILWGIFAVVFCSRMIWQGIDHPDRHLDHTVYPVLSEGSKLWWTDQPLHARIESLNDIFRYSPTFAILFTPFAVLPEWLGACLWGLLSIGIFVTAMRVLTKELLPGSWTAERQGIFLGLTLLGAMSGIHSGQSNAILVSSVIFALVAIKYDRWWMASFLLAFPSFIKIWPLAVVLLLTACWPKKLSWRFAIVAVAFALLPFLCRPSKIVIWQYGEWYNSLIGPQHRHRWPGFRDAWTIWERLAPAFGFSPEWPSNGYHWAQLISAVGVLGWCLWMKRRLTSRTNLLTGILSIWVSWQLLFGPGSEQITYGIIAPSAAWAVMMSFEKRKNISGSAITKPLLYLERGWVIAVWLTLGLFGMGDIETPLAKIYPAATILLPVGVIMFAAWLIIYYLRSSDCLETLRK